METRRQWDGKRKVLKEKNQLPRVLYLAKLPANNEREIKTTPDKRKFRESAASTPALKDC